MDTQKLFSIPGRPRRSALLALLVAVAVASVGCAGFKVPMTPVQASLWPGAQVFTQDSPVRGLAFNLVGGAQDDVGMEDRIVVLVRDVPHETDELVLSGEIPANVLLLAEIVVPDHGIQDGTYGGDAGSHYLVGSSELDDGLEDLLTPVELHDVAVSHLRVLHGGRCEGRARGEARGSLYFAGLANGRHVESRGEPCRGALHLA